MNDLEIVILTPRGPQFIYGISADLTIAGISTTQVSPIFTFHGANIPFIYGQYYRVFFWDITVDTAWSLERSQSVRVTKKEGETTDQTPNLHAVLKVGNTSTLNAEIAKLFLSNAQTLSVPSRSNVVGWDALTREVGLLSDAQIADRFGSGGTGTGTALPAFDATGAASIMGHRSGLNWTLSDAQLQARLVTLTRLYTLINGATEGTTQNITHLTGIGPNGVFKFPLASLPSNGGTNTNTTVTQPAFINLPQSEYVTAGIRPRRFRIGILPAPNGGTTDIFNIALTGGPWANINAFSVSTITALFRNRANDTTGFRGRYDRTGPVGPVVLECWRQSDGSVFVYAYNRAGEPYATGHFLAHGSGGASVDRSLTPVTGTLANGDANPNPNPSGVRIFSSDIDLPISDFNDERHLTRYSTIIDNQFMARQLKANDPSPLRNPATALLILKDANSDEYVPATPAQEDQWLTAKGVAFIASNRPTGLLLNIALPDQLATVGTAKTISFPQNTFANGTAPYVFTMDSALPPGMNFTAGAISGTPLTAGSFPIFVIATDSSNPVKTGRTGFNIIIASNVNNAPYIAPIAPYQHTFGTTQTITLPAGTDPDNDALTYSIFTVGLISVNNAARQILLTNTLPVAQYAAQYTASDPGGISFGTGVVINVVQAANVFAMGTPIYNSSANLVTIVTTGGDGTSIVYSIIGVTPPTDSAGPHLLSAGLIADPKPITLIAIQSGVQVSTVLNLVAGTALAAPVAPTFTPLSLVVGQTVNVTRPSFTAPAGATIINYTYAGLPPGLSFGLLIAGSGQVGTAVSLNGTVTTSGSYTIAVTAYASNGTQTTAYWNVLVIAANTGGYVLNVSTNPGKLALRGRIENGYLLLENAANPGYGRYKINGQGVAPFPTTLNGNFPANGQTTYVEWFSGNEPLDSQESAAQHITFYPA